VLRTGRRAYSTLWWVGFLTFCLVPLAAFALGLGRYFYARAEVQKAADAGALAAAQEVDVTIYQNEGRIVLKPSAAGTAGVYADLNCGYLAARGIYPRITGITVDQGRRTVSVSMAADASALFPSVLHGITVHAVGEAEVRLKSSP
jgi:uncharacterized membrane protein